MNSNYILNIQFGNDLSVSLYNGSFDSFWGNIYFNHHPVSIPCGIQENDDVELEFNLQESGIDS